jgi:hypothetical protein
MSTPTPVTPVTTNLTTQKLDEQAQYQQLVDGIGTLLPGVDPFEIGGASVARAALLGTFQQYIDAAKATKALRLELAAQLAKEREAQAAAKPLRADFKVYLQGKYGRTSPQLQKFGFVQNRRPRRSAKNKAAGVEAASATRKKVGTKGRQQKAVAKAQASAPIGAPPAAPTPGGPNGAARS